MSGQTLTVKLFRGDNTSWGFRLQGGKDFSTPLSVQRVNPGSLADQAGLVTGDAIIKIHGHTTDSMRHKEAQDAIIRAGNNIELIIQRGGIRVWKPTVTPIGDLPTPATPPATGLYTKTSLAAKKQESAPIGSKHNVAPRPFAPLGGGKVLVNNQYNTPAPLYSMNNIADTLTAHTEVLATGAKGINFMKEDPPVNKDSAVYRMIMEEKEGGGTGLNHVDHHHQQPCRKDSPMSPTVPVTQHVSAPVTKQPSFTADRPKVPNACPECGKSIIGVFVRIKDKSLHPECFKCSTCGTSLKNIGYYNVNDKLYCDAHAQLAAKIAATMPTVDPVVISQPLTQSPVPNATSPTPQTPGAGPRSPAAYRSVSPVPFHFQCASFPPVLQKSGDIHHVEAPLSPQSILTPPIFKPSGPPAAPFSPTAASPAPTFKTPITPGSQTSSVPTAPPSNFGGTHVSGPGHKFVWPPQKTASTEPVLASNVNPTPPTYRPPPGTQHAASIPKYASPLSPVPNVASPTFGAPVPYVTSPTFGSPVPNVPSPTFGASVQQSKVPPQPSPKPRNPVQSTKAQTWNMSSTTSMTTSTSGAHHQSGVAMSAGQGSRPAPRRGRGQMKQQVAAGARIPICNICGTPIRGPFVLALGKSWCPDHFTCANNRCQRSLTDIGFVENSGQLYCENCYEAHLAPTCSKCALRIKGDCLNALDKQWHPNCFVCAYCHKPFGNSSFYMEDALPYCEKDWNELFTTKCVGCGFPIEAGDRWVEALNNNYHSQCFRCTICNKGLEGQSFYAKSGKPFCKAHSR